MKRFLTFIAAALIACAASVSCEDIKAPNNPDTPELPDIQGVMGEYDGDFILGKDTRLFSNAEMEFIIGKTEEGLIISRDATEDMIPGKGEIIICPFSENVPYGHLGKVISVSETPDGHLIKTEPVTLEEAFERLNVVETIDISEYIDTAVDDEGNVIIPQTLDPEDIPDFIAETKAQGEIAFTSRMPIENDWFEGALYAGYTMSINIDIDRNKLKAFDIAIEKRSGIQGQLTLASAEAEFECKFIDLEIKFKPVPIPGTPVLIVPILFADLKFESKAEISFTADMEYAIEHQRYALSYNGGKPTAFSEDLIAIEDRVIRFNDIEASAEMSIKETLGGKFGIYNEKLLSFGIELNVGHTFGIEGEISMEDKDLLKDSPKVIYSPSIDVTVFSESFLYGLAGFKDGRIETPFIWETRPFEIYALPRFEDLEINNDGKTIEAAADVDKMSLIWCQEKGFAIFDKDEEEALEHIAFDNPEDRMVNRDTVIFELPSTEISYKAVPYVKTFGMYYYGADTERWVDLGLPSGILWAAYNVGATSPEEYGGYYAWGETEEKAEYDEDTYNWDLGPYISSTQYDVAHVKWGDGARMPSIDEIKELIDICDWSASLYNGAQATGPNGNSIFIPFAGHQEDGGLEDNDYTFNLWSSTYIDVEDAYALCCYYSSDGMYSDWDLYCSDEGRSLGFSIRPVKEKETEEELE